MNAKSIGAFSCFLFLFLPSALDHGFQIYSIHTCLGGFLIYLHSQAVQATQRVTPLLMHCFPGNSRGVPAAAAGLARDARSTWSQPMTLEFTWLWHCIKPQRKQCAVVPRPSVPSGLESCYLVSNRNHLPEEHSFSELRKCALRVARKMEEEPLNEKRLKGHFNFLKNWTF